MMAGCTPRPLRRGARPPRGSRSPSSPPSPSAAPAPPPSRSSKPDSTPLHVTWLRVAGAALVMLPLAWRHRDLLRERPGLLAGFGLLAVAGVQACYFAALSRIPVGVALLIEYLAPALVLGWVRFVQRRPVSRAAAARASFWRSADWRAWSRCGPGSPSTRSDCCWRWARRAARSLLRALGPRQRRAGRRGGPRPDGGDRLRSAARRAAPHTSSPGPGRWSGRCWAVRRSWTGRGCRLLCCWRGSC